MAFPIIPVIIAFALYVLHDDDAQEPPKVKKNKSVKSTRPDIDDNSKSVPESPPPEPENSVPTVEIPETPPESENVQ